MRRVFFLKKIQVRNNRVRMIDYVWKACTASPFLRIGIKPFNKPHGVMQQIKRTIVSYAGSDRTAVVLNFFNVFHRTDFYSNPFSVWTAESVGLGNGLVASSLLIQAEVYLRQHRFAKTLGYVLYDGVVSR